MIVRYEQLAAERREAMRGGAGGGVARTYVGPGVTPGLRFVTRMTLDPGASIGLHRHEGDAELYVVLAGTGLGLLDGERFAVGPGDGWLCAAGHQHGVEAGPDGLSFLAVLTEPASASR